MEDYVYCLDSREIEKVNESLIVVRYGVFLLALRDLLATRVSEDHDAFSWMPEAQGSKPILRRTGQRVVVWSFSPIFALSIFGK